MFRCSRVSRMKSFTVKDGLGFVLDQLFKIIMRKLLSSYLGIYHVLIVLFIVGVFYCDMRCHKDILLSNTVESHVNE